MSRAARLGVFIIVTLGILTAGVYIIGSNQYLFSTTYQLNSQFDNVVGLTTGADVEVGGVQSGTVREINLPKTPGGRVTVVMELNKSTHQIIKQDSMASIETQGLLGNQYVAITFGSANDPEVKSGDTIGSYPPLQIGMMMNKMNSILDSANKIMPIATDTVTNVESITKKIDDGNGTAGALINDKTLYENMQQASLEANATMIHAQAGVADFQENMEALKHNFLLRGYFKSRGYEDLSELTADATPVMPLAVPVKSFEYSAKLIFDKSDSAELKDDKALNAAGDYFVNTQFGSAVIVASTGMTGDSQKDLLLTQARAMVVRDYLVDHYGFDDTKVKTLGMGKQPDISPDTDWGSIKILVYATGTTLPASNSDTKPKLHPIAATASSN